MKSDNSMRIPLGIRELLEERILFCQVQLQGINSIPCCQRKSEMLVEFEIAYNNYKALKNTLDTISKEIDTNDQLERRFKESSKVILNELITTALEQMRGECYLQSIHNSMNLVEGLQKIILEVDTM